MKTKFKTIALAAITLASVAIMLYSCNEHNAVIEPLKSLTKEKPVVYIGGGNSKGTTSRISVDECTVTEIDHNTTFYRDTIYVLEGDVRFTDSTTLTIESGTTIKGDKTSRARLTITVGSKIIAIGTASEPIMFTSNEPVGQRAPGDWCGVIIMGDAPINHVVNPPIYYSCVTPPRFGTIGSGPCGGNSGVLSYVRIEFAGQHYSLSFDSGMVTELGALTLCGVGSGTKIDHIQVSYSGDDSFLWLGGCVRPKYLISFCAKDDDFDSSLGYSGNVQFGIALRDPALADGSQSNGIESDNNYELFPLATPYTSATFSNFTLVGPYNPANTNTVINTLNDIHGDGIHLRKYTALRVINTVVAGFRLKQILDNTTNALAELHYNVAAAPGFNSLATCYQEDPETPEWTTGLGNTCRAATTATSLSTAPFGLIRQSGLPNAAWTLANPNVTPLTATGYKSPLLTTGTDASLLDPSFVSNETTSGAGTYFIGARRVADDNGWNFSTGWMNFDPQSVPYSGPIITIP